MGEDFRDPLKLITIGITSPDLAAGTEAFTNHEKLRERSSRPSPADLARLPWLDQSRAYRLGYYLLTHGLDKHANHLELEMCNVPGAFVPAAMNTLNNLAEYILNSSARLEHGQTINLGNDREAILGFVEIKPGSDPAVPHDSPVLRVVFVC